MRIRWTPRRRCLPPLSRLPKPGHLQPLPLLRSNLRFHHRRSVRGAARPPSSVSPTIEALLGCYPWVVLVPIGAACSEGIAAVYDLPIVSNPPPYHWKMINYADDIEVRFYSNAQLVKDPPCANLNVIYYLNYVQRQLYDKTPDQISIYRFDEVTHAWTDCKPNLVSDVGIHGVLVCSIKNWGFFALGHPSGQ